MVEMNPASTIAQIARSYCLSRCLHVIANLGVADALSTTPRHISDLASAVEADPGALGRVIRLLASHGVFTLQDGLVGHSPASRLLRSDHPQSQRAGVQMFGLPIFWDSFGAMEHAVRTGQPAVPSLFSEGFWDYLAQRPDEGRIFNAAMSTKTALGVVSGIVDAYDFSQFNTIADIGGGRGHLLRAVLNAAPNAAGVLFDLPAVIDDATAIDSERLRLQAGDFFRDALPRCDAYLLMEVIHDWDDDEAIAILRAVRDAAQPGATMLLIEEIIPDGPGPDWPKMLDIIMLTLFGGKQRTQQEYAVLLEQADFRFVRQIDTDIGASILEAQAV